MKLNWRNFLDMDWPLLATMGVLSFAGLLVMFSVDSDLFYKQLFWVILSYVSIVVLNFINLKAFFSYRWIILSIYLIPLVLLVIAHFFSPIIANTSRWLVIGGIQVQPSEFMKAALIILFSSFFAKKHVSIRSMATIFASFVYFAVPAFLVLVSPDLGTAIVLFAIWFGYLVLSEIPLKYIFALFLTISIAGVLAWNFGGLHDYQKVRIIGLFNPEYDPLGINYNVIQSKIAIGSGGLLGKGFGQGTQIHSGFLPNAGTDFAFSALVEEWGVLGGLFIISIFGFFIFRILQRGATSDNNFSKFICLGTAVFLISHFVLNLGSVFGLLPVVGVNMPFISSGGSNLLTIAVLVGIIQNIAKRRTGF